MGFLMASFVAALTCLVTVTTVQADREWEEYTSHYEDDAWYDVSEWLDGNDYNPTDEEWDEWDDEVFHESDEIEGNSDNDTNYGYDTSSNDDNWFYDYYDEGAYSNYDTGDNDTYDVGSRFYDFDNDGSYDAYSTFYDWDDDGLYDDYNYYFFSDTGKRQQKQARSQTSAESRKQQLTGEIEKIKQVHVRGGQNFVVAVQGQGKQLFVDLGKADKLKKFNLKEGDKISVSGFKTQVGDTNVLVAQSLQSGNQKAEINRERREIQGKVLSTHKTNVRGSEHLIAMLNTDRAQGKLAVDLGPANNLNVKVNKGAGLTLRAVPVKVKDKKMLMALYVQEDSGQWKSIDRTKSKAGSKTNKQG